jgi:EAL domain-containing protein (putative c-di-GMP-specific phosphodiesterase class I)
MHEFRVGMSHGDVRAYAQPVVELTSGVVVGYRGLARWQHPRLGLLDDAAFVPMIAETPLANEVDLYVARETAAMLTVIARESTQLRLYFPASRRLVADVRTEQFLWEIADAFSIRMQHVCVQVGRPLLDDWTPALQDALHSLADAGVTLVATDVGEAADVRPLAALGFNEVHLADRVVHAAATDERARAAVAEIVKMAHDSGLLVAAAGVDLAVHGDALGETGCNFATGDLYGEPRPTDTIE